MIYCVCPGNGYILNDFNTESFGYTSLKEDTRSDFLGHVVINFEWNKLHNRESWSGTRFKVNYYIMYFYYNIIANIVSVELSVISITSRSNEDACGINQTFTTKLPKVQL